MPTRVVHRVRCRKKDNKQVWADVKVVDAVTVLEPGGQEKLLWIKASDANPCIIDKTKAAPSFEKGTPDQCTRLSHMELVVGQDDPTQKMYVEVLDALVFAPPPNHNVDEAEGGAREMQPERHGLPKAATFGKNLYGLFLAEKDAIKFVVDKVGLDLDSGSSDKCSRAAHVNLVTEKGNTDEKTAEATEIPPTKQSWVATVKPDAINFKVPGGGNVCLVLPRGLQEEIDSTEMTTDPDTGDPCPPDNKDPNVYVSFPQDNTGDPNAPVVGCNLKIPKMASGNKGIDQGPLWWIERISSPFQPWFWFAKVQSPQAFSFFGAPGRLGSWAYRGFVLWNNYPVIWILSANLPLIPMGSFGSPSLDLCARIGNWDFAFPPVPWGPAFVPPRPETAIFPFSALSFSGPIEVGDGHPAPYGPFGCLQMTHPPLGKFPDAVPYGNSIDGNDGSQIWSQIPNIWQLTDLPQPKRADMTKPWNPFNNPIVPPSVKDAKTAAIRFRDYWNKAADGHNEFIKGYVPDGKENVYAEPPGWSWNMAYYDPFRPQTAGPKYYGAFRNGIPVACATAIGIPLVDFIPATAWTMEVDQLDPKIWDTTKLELFSNPLNWFLPLVIPPLRRP